MDVDYRDLLMRLIVSLTLCDHMGDAGDDVNTVLKITNPDIKWDDWDDLRTQLTALGYKGLYDRTIDTAPNDLTRGVDVVEGV